MGYRIIYKKIFESQKDAEKAVKEVKDKAHAPYAVCGKSAGWVVVLYEHEKPSKIEEGVKYYESKGLTVFVQKV